MSAQSWAEVIILIACVVVAAEGGRAASVLQRLQQDPNRFLSTILVSNTVALILASSVTTLLAQEYLPHGIGFWGDLAVSLVLSIFLLIFAEVTPKTLAIRNADRIALMMAGPAGAL